jgi:neutral ceramidase
MRVTKARRVAFRASAAIAALIGVLLVLCLDRVDHSPYFQQPYYHETLARLRAGAETNRTVRGPLEAGFGSARLTPTINSPADSPEEGKFRALPLAGYGDRQGRPATGVHDDLYVKAVALRVQNVIGILFGADALIVPREVADAAAKKLSDEFGLRREQLYFSATHTHCSIGGWGEGPVGELFAGDFNPGARLWFVDRLVTAARQALADLRPAEFGHGSFQAPEYVRNRLVGELGEVDPEFSYLVFKQSDGRTAVLGSYSAHATVLSGRVMEFSADYPGYWQRAIEKATGGAALFLAGSVGSHAPVSGGKSFEGAERMGEALARKLLSELTRIPATNVITFGIAGLEVSLPPLNLRVRDGIRLRPWITKQLLPVGEQTFLQAFRIGDAVWISTPCDFSGELARDIKNQLRLDGFSAAITSFNGDYIGYVIPSRYYHLNGYEPRVMSFFGPNVPDYLDELIRKLTAQLSRNKSPDNFRAR